MVGIQDLAKFCLIFMFRKSLISTGMVQTELISMAMI